MARFEPERVRSARVGPARATALLTWVAFVAITAVAAYSMFQQILGLFSRTT